MATSRIKLNITYPNRAGESRVLTWGTKTTDSTKKGLQAKHGNRYSPKTSPGVQVELDILAKGIVAREATAVLYNKKRQAALLTQDYFFGMLDGIEKLLGNGQWSVPVRGRTYDHKALAEQDEAPTFVPTIPDIPIKLEQLEQHGKTHPDDFRPIGLPARVSDQKPTTIRPAPADTKGTVNVPVKPGTWRYLTSDYAKSREQWDGLQPSTTFKAKTGATRAGFSQYAGEIKRDWAWTHATGVGKYGGNKFVSSQFEKNYANLQPGQKRFEGGKFSIAFPRMMEPLDTIVRQSFMYKESAKMGSWMTVDLGKRNDNLAWNWRFGNAERTHRLMTHFAAEAGKVWMKKLKQRMRAVS